MNSLKQSIIGSHNSQVIKVNLPNGEKHPLASAMESIIGNIKDDPDFEGFIEELLCYTHARTVIGLEGKLSEANKTELLAEAKDLKEKFAKKLQKEQLSLTVQHFYAHILSYIRTLFITKVKPKLEQGSSVSEIENSIYEDIVLNIYRQTAVYTPDLTTDHIAGMLYYLTGKCHLSWRT